MLLFVMAGVGLWIRNREARNPGIDALAGLCIGIGSIFKLFAVLSLASACLLFLLMQRRTDWRGVLSILSGFAVPWIVIGIWAAAGGFFAPMWTQSVVMPLFDYPAHTEYLSDFSKRIGWFVILISPGMVWSALNGFLWKHADRGSPAFLLAVFGLPYLLPLFKNQAAHYLIPFIPFAVAWLLWSASLFAQRVSPSLSRGVAVVVAAIALVVGGWLFAYKKSSLQRIVSQDPTVAERKAAAGFARWVAPGERAMLINAGPYPHIALYWMTGERPYPWPFPALTGFVKKPIEQFGFERFYRLCADSKTRIVAMRFDIPMDSTLPWVFSQQQISKLQQLIHDQYVPHPEFPGVFLRKGSKPVANSFRRGPFRGESF